MRRLPRQRAQLLCQLEPSDRAERASECCSSLRRRHALRDVAGQEGVLPGVWDSNQLRALLLLRRLQRQQRRHLPSPRLSQPHLPALLHTTQPKMILATTPIKNNQPFSGLQFYQKRDIDLPTDKPFSGLIFSIKIVLFYIVPILLLKVLCYMSVFCYIQVTRHVRGGDSYHLLRVLSRVLGVPRLSRCPNVTVTWSEQPIPAGAHSTGPCRTGSALAGPVLLVPPRLCAGSILA